ncbi:Putative NADPH-quinone reductase, YabF family (fragment) [Xenorhabdus nematophila ATCC 19061]|uniref:NADPH-quinone reductase, YabF family n=1 Tax=Xenorhabdus nematophila (strain ATCC 19061 / DSM 3370 / CCUG 14189 / LMG 1036 / NCIMB 9965 / AN6) TaxID=406817 RepID=D3VG69_XENNA
MANGFAKKAPCCGSIAIASPDFEALHRGEVLPDVAKSLAMVKEADHLIFIYSVWWFGQPAILKGWIDRVFSNGFAYYEDEKGFTPYLTGKSATIFITLGTPEQVLAQNDMELDHFMRGMTLGTLGLVGIYPTKIVPFYAIPKSSDEERRMMLESVTI